MSLIEEFVKHKIIDSEEAFSIEERLKESGKSLDELLLEREIPASKIIEVKREYFSDVPFKPFDSPKPLSEELMDIISLESVQRYKIAPLGFSEDGYLEVGMLNPEDLNAKTILQFVSTKIGKPYRIFLISWEYYEFILRNYKGVKGEVSKALDQYIDAQAEEREKEEDAIDESDIIREDAPIAKIVSNIIRGAAEKKASDIHIEINDKEVSVRYRIDGIMKKDLVLPKNIHRAVVARVKILSRIQIDERRKPQDGRFSGKFLGRKIDFRVSTFPTYYGEKVVMRLLEQDRGALPIEEIGFSEENLKKIKKIIKNPYGIILVCGPTGSGKTNTLYSLLNEIDKTTVNVVSLEDPIELNVPGVSQSQVRPEIGYTFASGLRSILRQDPDIIMVGEIRDEETAKLAIEASLTGHLVFSTIHTNTAADVPQRLIDMGVEPYLIGPTLVATVGQRLVRKIVPEMREELEMPEEIREFIKARVKDLPPERQKEFLSKNKIYEPKKIEGESGMKGRTAVFEILEMTDNIRRLILKDPSSISIFTEARKTGYITFKEDGIKKALEGITTFEEVMKL